MVGRGLGLGIAQEAALKLKEACGLHAEAFSSAELRHGPVALVGRGFPVFAFAQGDETRADVESLARELAGVGASVLLAGVASPRGARAADDPHASRDRAAAPDPELLPVRQRARQIARPRSGPAASPAESDRDGLMAIALINGRVLGDDGILEGRTVLLDGGRIVDVVSGVDARCSRAAAP